MNPTPEVAIVVGAARGIGHAVAEKLAGRGTTVVGWDRLADTLDAAATGFAERGLVMETQAVDVTDQGAVEGAMAKTLDRHEGVQVLVNCAGVTGKTGIRAHEVDPADFDHVYRINMLGALFLTRAVVPGMLAGNYGRILHVASIAGKEGNAGMTAYSATKAGLIGLVKSAAKDYADSGITINALAPAVVLTDMVAALPQDVIDYMTGKIPMKRTGSLEEVAAMVDWIVSPACSFTTGFTFDLSGGRATY